MSIYKEQRVGVLVDIQNLYYSAKVLYGKKVNFGAVLKEAVGDRKLIRAIAYGIKTVEGLEEKFFDALLKSGYEVKTKDLQIFPGGAKKGDWDVVSPWTRCGCRRALTRSCSCPAMAIICRSSNTFKTPPAAAWRWRRFTSLRTISWKKRRTAI